MYSKRILPTDRPVGSSVQESDQKAYVLPLRRSPRSPSFPTASQTGVPDAPSILAFLRCPRHFLCFSIILVGRFPELTPVRSQTTSRGFLPWKLVTEWLTRSGLKAKPDK